MPDPIVDAYLVVLALILGSFIGLAADRIPRGESIVRPRSHCRSCGRTLNWVDLLPVAGYLVRRGRCATCGSPIGVSALVVEAASGAGMLIAVMLLGPVRGGIVGLVAIVLSGLVLVSVSTARRAAGRGVR